MAINIQTPPTTQQPLVIKPMSMELTPYSKELLEDITSMVLTQSQYEALSSEDVSYVVDKIYDNVLGKVPFVIVDKNEVSDNLDWSTCYACVQAIYNEWLNRSQFMANSIFAKVRGVTGCNTNTLY